MILTAPLLASAIGCPLDRAQVYADHLRDACLSYDISTPERMAAFLGQLGHESASFRYVREIASGAAYEGRADLGNTQPGDGVRYRGRGLMQVTGRANYRRVTRRLRAKLGAVPDFEAEPEQLEQPRWAAYSAGDYWDAHGLNAYADAGDFEAITQKINGKLNGQADRLARWLLAKQALASFVAAPASATPTVKESLTPEPIPQPEPSMLPLIAALGNTLIAALTPLAAEKIQKEISRHTDNTAVAEQITSAVVDAAIAATGKTDPIEAVAAAKSDPEVMARVEQSTLDRLASMAPMLERLAALDREQFADEEASRAAAAQRAAADPHDVAPLLTRAALGGIAALIIFVGGIVVLQIIKTGKADAEVWALLVALVTWAMSRAGSIYDYRFGSSRGSSTKDVVIGELSKKGR